jgi:hypothetical protein
MESYWRWGSSLLPVAGSFSAWSWITPLKKKFFSKWLQSHQLHFIQGKASSCWLHISIRKATFPWKWSEICSLLSYQLSYLDNLYLFLNNKTEFWVTLYKYFCFNLNVFKTILIMQITFLKLNNEINDSSISSRTTRPLFVHNRLESTVLGYGTM